MIKAINIKQIVIDTYKTCVTLFGNAVMFGLIAYWVSKLFV